MGRTGGGLGGGGAKAFCVGAFFLSLLGVHSGDVKYISSASHTLSFLPKKNMTQSAKTPSNPIGLGFAGHAHMAPSTCLLTAGASTHRPSWTLACHYIGNIHSTNMCTSPRVLGRPSHI